MMVRPVAFVVVAVMVVVGAAAGAYLAVRQNGPGPMPAPPIASGMPAKPDQELPAQTEVELGRTAVDATEELLDPAPPVPEPDAPAPREPRIETAPAPSPPPVARASTDTEPSSPPSESRQGRRRSDLPEVEGWTRSESWPTREREEDPGPTQVALAKIPNSSLGTELDPEDRPLIVEELIISADSVVGLQIDTPVSSDDAEVEDDVEARVTRDVVVGDHVAIPAGSRVLGSVVLVDRAGKIKGASRLGVRFHTVVLDDDIEIPLMTETVYREGQGKGGASAGKIGGAAVGGAILGAIFGGRQGAAIGGAAGAAGGTAAAMAGDGQPATLPAGATVTVRLSQPATVTVERYAPGP